MAREKAPQDANDKAQRRVYVLPNELVERIGAFQKELGLNSEVEAVRRLLDGALKERDEPHQIVARLVDQLKSVRSLRDAARDVLVDHPLITSIDFDFEMIAFKFKDGHHANVSISGIGTIWDHNDNLYDFGINEPPKWASSEHQAAWRRRPNFGRSPMERKSMGSDSGAIDDDIPF